MVYGGILWGGYVVINLIVFNVLLYVIVFLLRLYTYSLTHCQAHLF